MFSYIKNNKNWYLLELPLIKRNFDSIYINYKNSTSAFWDFFESILFENTIFWISKFGEKYLFYYLDLEKVIENEFLVFDFKFFNINIFNKKYSILVLTLENWQNKIFSSLDNSDFEVFIEKNILKVKNKVLGSIVFEKKLKPSPSHSQGERGNQKINKNYTSILDIYFFNNLFIKSEKLLKFSKNIESFNFQNKEFNNDFFPKNKLEVFEKWEIKKRKTFYNSLLNSLPFQGKEANGYQKLELLKKYLLFKNNYDFILESINYEDLLEYFEEFNFIDKNTRHPQGEPLQNLFWKINLEKLDTNLQNINKQIQDFTMNYFNLEQNYDKIKKLNSEYKNSKILEQNKRLELFKKDLEKVRGEYLKYFREFLEKIN